MFRIVSPPFALPREPSPAFGNIASAEAVPERRIYWLFPPLSPALSPLRREGAHRMSPPVGERLAALQATALNSDRARTRRCALERPGALGASPSRLNGERAGVRGGKGQKPHRPEMASRESASRPCDGPSVGGVFFPSVLERFAPFLASL
jgi:hypothetical protein